MKSLDLILSDAHCSVVLELEHKQVSPMGETFPSRIQMKRIWSEVEQVEFLQHLRTRNFFEIQTRFEDELQTDTVANNGNASLIGLLLDSSKSVGALKYKNKSAFEPRNNWFDNDCQNRRRRYRKKLREANKTSNNCENKAAAKE